MKISIRTYGRRLYCYIDLDDFSERQMVDIFDLNKDEYFREVNKYPIENYCNMIGDKIIDMNISFHHKQDCIKFIDTYLIKEVLKQMIK